jgi:hypothetical protein
MTPVDVHELARKLDWFFLARRLAKVEEHTVKILSYPADPRKELAQKILDLIGQIRRQRHAGFNISLAVSNLEKLIRAADALVLRPLVEIGIKVQTGGKKGAKARRRGDTERRVKAFLKARQYTTSIETALEDAAKQCGVSSRTIRRACKDAIGRNNRK